MNGNKFVTLLKSRKFWASVVGIFASLGLLNGFEEPKLVESLVVIATAIAYILCTAWEDSNKPIVIVEEEIEEEEEEEAGNVARRRK